MARPARPQGVPLVMPSAPLMQRCQMMASSYPSLYGAALHGGQAFEGMRGAKGTRTPGLLDANQTLFQLSYSPEMSLRQGYLVRTR